MKKILAIAVATAISAPAMADMSITGETGATFGADAKGVYGLSVNSVDLGVSASGEFGETTVTAAGAFVVSGESEVASDNNSIKFANPTYGSLSIATGSTGDDYGVDGLLGEVGNIGGGTAFESITYSLPTIVEGLGISINYLEVSADGDNADDINEEYRFTYAVSGINLALQMKPGSERTRGTASTTMGALTAAVGYETTENTDRRTSLALGYDLDDAQNVAFSYAAYDSEAATGEQTGYEVTYTNALSSNVELEVNYNQYEDEEAAGSSMSGGASATVTLSF